MKDYKFLFEKNPHPMWIYDEQLLSFLEVNDAAVSNYGYTREEFLNMTIKDIRPEEDIEKLLIRISNKNRSNLNTGIWRHKKKNGEIIFVEIISHLIEHKNKPARLVIINDVTEKKRSKDELELAYSQLTNLYNNLPEAIFSVDPVNNKMLLASPAHETIFGYSSEEFFKNPKLWYDLIVPEDKPIIDAGYPTLFAGQILKHQYRINHPSGEIRWIEVSMKPTLDESRNLIRIDGVASDITNRKQTENALLKTEQKLREILDNSTNLFYSHTPDQVITYVSPQSKKLLGFDPEEVKMRWTELLTDNPINLKGIELTQLAIETGIPQEPYELEVRKNSKEKVWFEVNETPIMKDGKTVLMVGSLTDITARKKAEEELQASQSLLTSALEMANMGHWEYNVITDTFTFNDQFYKMFRTSVNEIGSYTMSSIEYANRFVHPDDLELVGIEIQNAINTADPNYYKELEHRIIFADGEIGTIAVRFNIVKDRNGKTIKTYGVNQDITKRKLVEYELIEAKERAEESSRLKSSFLANMSHELRTPLVGILGFAELLSVESKDPQHLEMSQIIHRSGRRLMETLNSILDVSRIEANKQEIKLSKFNLSQIIIETTELFRQAAKDKELTVKTILPKDALLLNSDRDIIIKILNNLISNAVKYTHRGGIVIKAYIKNSSTINSVIIDVSDTGIGIKKEHQDIIFEPFRQVSEGTSRNYEGAGLGLSITKKFVDLLNGSISFISEVGRGSTFSVRLPLSEPETLVKGNGHKPVNDSLSSGTDELFSDVSVLVVEDDSSNASVICTYLKDFVSVDHVFDGYAAIDNCKHKLYDVVLMDINLKGMNGIDTFRQIRLINDHYSQIPYVAVTAYAMFGDKEKFLSIGFNRYLSKPFSKPELLNLLTNIINDSLKK